MARVSVRLGALCVLSPVLLAVTGCKDDPKKAPVPHPPVVQSPVAKCELIEERYVLKSVAFDVQDLDGVTDLKLVTATIEHYAPLPVTATTVPLTQAQIDAGDLEGPVVNHYTWERGTEGNDFYCGEAGDLLDVNVRAEDVEGFFNEVLIGPSAI